MIFLPHLFLENIVRIYFIVFKLCEALILYVWLSYHLYVRCFYFQRFKKLIFIWFHAKIQTYKQ